MMMSVKTLISICWLFGISLVIAKQSPIVQVKNGSLEGTLMTSRRGREIFSFRGIPYAEPPIGELRFEPPKPYGSWNGVRSAKDDANACPQKNWFGDKQTVTGVEDCLYLNVYTPTLPSNMPNQPTTNYPVMVWIHGGGWIVGSSDSKMYGPHFLLDHDVILVTFNYRLGPLGFFATGDLVSPGNQGLKDQTQAIKWVNENIAAFNGDPNRITIFGESAGGGSVHYHMISPLSRGLFHRAISESGVVLNPWTLSTRKNTEEQVRKIGEHLDCPTSDSSMLVACLKKKSFIDIVSILCPSEILDKCPPLQLRPSIEPDHPGAFVKEEPAQSLKSGRIADIPWITGTNAHEGALSVAPFYGSKDKNYVQQLDEQFMKLAPQSLLYGDTCLEKLLNNVTNSIRQFYLGDKKIDEATRWNVIDMYTDAYFYVGTDNAVRDHLKALSSPIYYYYFAYKGSSSFNTLVGDSSRNYGVYHGDELQYLFPLFKMLFTGKPMNEEDLKVADLMTTLWFNFAKSGNPTPENTPEIPFKWKPVRTSNLEYLHIGSSKDLRMADNLHKERIEFWASVPHRGKIIIDDNSTYKEEL